ncbi:hypothetical protein C8Q79DRAFT_120360 [Trametes meyenii]|nr:hypothetical protein C8Q79DRAFT_120360 [Trametes meyenii]
MTSSARCISSRRPPSAPRALLQTIYMVLLTRTVFSFSSLVLLANTIRPCVATSVASVTAPLSLQCPLPLILPARAMSTTGPASPAPTTPAFLQEKLSTLLASPHIHFNHPPRLGGLRLGPGPVDLFSTRFANFFTPDATGVVAGKPVDHEGLKSALLALQKRWDPQTANFVAPDGGESASAKVRNSGVRPCLGRARTDYVLSQPTTKFLWTQKQAGQKAEVTAAAEVKEEGGAHRIHHLTLDGDESLFSE